MRSIIFLILPCILLNFALARPSQDFSKDDSEGSKKNEISNSIEISKEIGGGYHEEGSGKNIDQFEF